MGFNSIINSKFSRVVGSGLFIVSSWIFSSVIIKNWIITEFEQKDNTIIENKLDFVRE